MAGKKFWEDAPLAEPVASQTSAPVAGAGTPLYVRPKTPPAQTPLQTENDALTNERLSRDLSTPQPVQGAPGYFWGPDGKPFRPDGLPANVGADPKLQEAERTAAFLATRLAGGIKDMKAALATDQGAAKPGVGASFLGLFSTTAANWANSPARRQVEAAQMEVLDAALTLGTGAAYTREQLENYRGSYFPALGDDEVTIKVKQERLLRVLEAAKLKAGNAAPQIDAIIGDLDPARKPDGTREDPNAGVPLAPGRAGYALEDLPAPPAPVDENVDEAALTPPAGEVFKRWEVNNLGRAYPIFGPPEQRQTQGGFAQGVDATVRGAASTVSLGFDDEIAAIVDTVFKGGTYNRNLVEQRAIDGYDEENNFGARLTGQIGGALLLPSGVKNVIQREAAAVAARGGTQAEAVAAARAIAARQLGKEGAGYGAGYGAGSANGDLGDRAGNAALSGAIGAATGYGAGRALGRVLVPGGAGQAGAGRGASAEQVDAAQAARDLGIDLPRFVAGGPGAQNIGASLSRSPGGAKPISDATEKMLTQAQGAADDIAARVGNAVEPEQMGTAAVAAGKKSIKAERARIGKIYDAARTASGNVRIEAPETGKTLNQLAANEEQTLGNTAAGKVFRDLLSDLRARGGVLSVDGARSTRSELRKRLTKEAELSPDNADRLTDLVMDAIGLDIANGLKAAGKQGAVPLYRQADREWRLALQREDDIIKPFIGKDGDNWGDDAARNILRDVKANGPRIAEFLSAIGPTEANNIRATVIGNLGRSGDGAQNAAGDAFSLDTFLTNWNRIRGARNLIFPKETVAALDKLAKVAERVKKVNRERPPSGTAIWGAAMAGPSALGGGYTLATGDPQGLMWGAMASGLTVGGQRSAAKLLASPKFAQRLAATPANPRAAAQYWSRPWVAKMAKANPAIATEMLGFQQALLSKLGSDVARPLAASTGDNEQQANQR